MRSRGVRVAEPYEKLAASLEALKALQEEGRSVFRSRELSRTHRGRLVRNGFLQEVIKGWLISTNPAERAGDSTPCYASFWEFCAQYCGLRFGADWHLSPEQSLLLQAGNTVIPKQVIVSSPQGANNNRKLLFDTSIYDLKVAAMPPRADLDMIGDLRGYATPAALTRVPEGFYRRYPIEARIILSQFRDASEILRRLLAAGQSAVAGRLVGAFRRVGKADLADEIATTMKAADYVVRETDPFEADQAFAAIAPAAAPIVGRLQALWEKHRQDVIASFPKAPGLPADKAAYLRAVEEVYKSDAYHSLSIEGYRVSPELIERVRGGGWNPDASDADRKNRDALAARGYWQAFQAVKADVGKVIAGADPGTFVEDTHRNWYRELFQPFVAAGLIGAEALAGYRNDAVYIRGSRHVPPRWQAVRDAVPTLFELMRDEKEPAVRALLGHWMIGYIHPFPDGNGRIARFLMNVMLASGGYSWTVIRVDERDAYMAALERASVDTDIGPFADFVAQQMEKPPEDV
jgi:fido (protein-threonine AMPylation protein)